MTSVSEDSAQVDRLTDEENFFAIVVRAWAHIDSRFANLSQESKVTILSAVITVLLTIILFVAGASSANQAHAEDLTAAERLTEEVREARKQFIAEAEKLSHGRRRMLTRRSLPLREEHEAGARRLGTVPEGQELEVIDQVDRWLYVQYVDNGAACSGWVYYRNLSPLSTDSPVE